VWPIFTNSSLYWSIQLNKWNTTKASTFLKFHSGGEPGICKQNIPGICTFLPFSPLSLTLRRLFHCDICHRKLPPHHFCLAHRLRKTANMNGKKLISLKPVVRTRRSYKRVGLTELQKSFQVLDMYCHEVLMFLQTRENLEKLFGTFYTVMWH
jgi:hypothetical protein